MKQSVMAEGFPSKTVRVTLLLGSLILIPLLLWQVRPRTMDPKPFEEVLLTTLEPHGRFLYKHGGISGPQFDVHPILELLHPSPATSSPTALAENGSVMVFEGDFGRLEVLIRTIRYEVSFYIVHFDLGKEPEAQEVYDKLRKKLPGIWSRFEPNPFQRAKE